MKITLLSLALVAAVLTIPHVQVLAQADESTCVEQCVARDTDCKAEAFSDLQTCLADATSPTEKKRCVVEFKPDRFACRLADEACLAACTD